MGLCYQDSTTYRPEFVIYQFLLPPHSMIRTASLPLAANLLLSCVFASASAAQSGDVNCAVERIIDGDTFVCEDGEHVRLLLVNTPEMGQEPYGRLARKALREMIPPGTRVRLVTDIEPRDRYGRVLAHVHVGDSLWVNRELARRGYAEVMVVPPNVRRVVEIRAAARSARRQEVGFWDEDVLARSAEPDQSNVPARRSDGEDCHPSYPDTCVPPPPPDLNCSDLSERHIRVRGKDPHRLDADGDGWGCEG